MSEEPKSFWNKSRSGRQWLGAWLMVAAATFVILLTISLFLPGGPTSLWQWGQASAVLAGASLAIASWIIGLWCFLRWVWRPRNLKRFLFGLVCFVTFVALIYAEEDFRGKRAWNQFRREWEAKGEKFDLASFIPPAVPDEQNLAMTPLLRPILDYYHSTNGVQWRDTNAYARLDHLSIYATDLSGDKTPEFGTADTLTDLGRWRAYYQSSTNFPHAQAASTSAEAVLVALGKYDAEMSELREAAAKRPLARFPIHYEENPPFGILLPHLARMKSLCQLFRLHAIAMMELGRGAEALTDLEVCFRLSDSIRNEPFLIDHLVRIATVRINLACLREGLMRRIWDDAQLAQLVNDLKTLDILAEYKANMRGERSFNLSGLEYYHRMGSRVSPEEFLYMGEDGGAQGPPLWGNGINLLPGGLYDQNKVTIARLHQEFTLAAVDEQKHRVYPAISRALTNVIARLRPTPYNLFAKLLMPAFANASRKSARAQADVDSALVCCAIERYRLANHTLPDSLDALVPRFLETIPTDLMDGQPLRYRKTPDGGYLIYSIGWNEKDDGGKVAYLNGRPPSSDEIRTPQDETQGDWIWQMPGK